MNCTTSQPCNQLNNCKTCRRFALIHREIAPVALADHDWLDFIDTVVRAGSGQASVDEEDSNEMESSSDSSLASSETGGPHLRGRCKACDERDGFHKAWCIIDGSDDDSNQD